MSNPSAARTDLIDKPKFFSLVKSNIGIGLLTGLLIFSMTAGLGLLLKYAFGQSETKLLCQAAAIADVKTLIVLIATMLVMFTLQVLLRNRPALGAALKAVQRDLLGAVLFITGAIPALLVVLLGAMRLQGTALTSVHRANFVSSMVILASLVLVLWFYYVYLPKKTPKALGPVALIGLTFAVIAGYTYILRQAEGVTVLC